MSLPLNTLFVTTEGALVRKDHETVVVKTKEETIMTVPMHMLQGIVCFGPIMMTPALMGACADKGIGISFLTKEGRFQARVEGTISGNVLLRRAQYRAADSEELALGLAKGCIVGKIANARNAIMRASRETEDGKQGEILERTTSALRERIQDAVEASSIAALRGTEGAAAASYFEAFPALIRNPLFSFSGRSRRPPRDPINTMLSFLYTVLMHDIVSALQSVGLDPSVGYLHVDRPGRPGLALDLMEEFRAILVDRVVLSLVNRKQVRPEDFESLPTGEVRTNDKTRKELIMTYQKRKSDMIRHPFLDTNTTVGMLPHLQARLLARTLRGDLDAYPPFFHR